MLGCWRRHRTSPMARLPLDQERARLVRTGICLVGWFAVLYALRYGYFEISPEADPCLRDIHSTACSVRATLGTTIHWQIFGLGSLGAACIALLVRGVPRRWLATTGLFVAAAALVLYNSRYGAPAAALSVVALVGAESARDS